jgi:hypothetical protein
MKSRHLGVGLAVLALSMFSLAGTAFAHTTSSTEEEAPRGTCVVHSLPSFVLQGEFENTATVADIVEVECDPTIYGTGSKIKITANQLFSLCKGNLTWYVPNPFTVSTGRGISVELDPDGNAIVAVRGGPFCSAGESLITAHMEEEPFESFTTSFTVLPPVPTPQSVRALAATPGAPETQVETGVSSGIAAIIETEFTNGSEKFVHISSEELYQRCRLEPHLLWIRENGEITEDTPEVTGIQLDNDGNAFVIVLGDSSCAPGASLIEADLESKPFTTLTTYFTIEAPRPT